ncbi:MAG: hypothetical protein R3D32_10105 [Nitratireductor sp.]
MNSGRLCSNSLIPVGMNELTFGLQSYPFEVYTSTNGGCMLKIHSEFAFMFVAILYIVHFLFAFRQWRKISTSDGHWSISFSWERTYFYVFFAFLVPVVFQFVATSYFVLFDIEKFGKDAKTYVFLCQGISISIFTTLIAIEGTTLGVTDSHFDVEPENPFRRHVLASLFLDILALITICGMVADPFSVLSGGVDRVARGIDFVYMGLFVAIGCLVSIYVLCCRLFVQANRNLSAAGTGNT